MQPKNGWREKVLVGTVRSDEQFNACITNKFYYVPLSVCGNITLPVSYIALYRAQNTTYPGIHFFAKVKKIKRVKRKKIPFPMTRDNRDEDYILFETARWQRLERPISYFNTAVYTVRSTNLFLLQNHTKSNELFIADSEREYELYKSLALAVDEHLKSKEEYRLELDESFSFLLFNGYINIIDKEGRAEAQFSATSFSAHPELIFTNIKNKTRQLSDVLDTDLK